MQHADEEEDTQMFMLFNTCMMTMCHVLRRVIVGTLVGMETCVPTNRHTHTRTSTPTLRAHYTRALAMRFLFIFGRP